MKPHTVLLSTFAAMAAHVWPVSIHAADAEWPQFRGSTGQGLSAAAQIPVTWDTATNVAWKVEVPGLGWSSPVIAGGRVYLTSATGGEAGTEPALHALCFDAGTGAVIWDQEVFRPSAASFAAMHQKNSPASPTAIVADGRVYVHFGHMGTAALDLAGKVLWRQSDLGYPPVHGAGGSPALIGDALVFSADGAQDPFLVALDAATGAVRWKTPRATAAKRTFSFSTPLSIDVAGKQQIISPASGLVAAYDLGDGREIWRVTYGEGYSVVPRPVLAHGLLFVSSGFDRPTLYAIRPDGAAGDVTASNVAWTLTKGAPLTPSTLVVGDELYAVSDSGIATCVDARTGAVHWTERLGGGFSASPIAAEGRVYCLNESGVTFVVRAGRTFELLAKNELGERALASPAAVDGALFIRTEKHLWKIASAPR